MARDPKTKATTWSIAALQVGALCLLTAAAFAAPPQIRLQSRMANAVQAPAQHLDLRLPAHAIEGNGPDKSPGTFPSIARRANTPQQAVDLPMMGSENMRAHSTVQDFVRQVHREGLPVARLFETKSALVHLGLSPRGKPGLWLVQKTH